MATMTTVSATTVTAPATTVTVPATTVTVPATTTTVTKRAPQLAHPGLSAVWAVPYDPGEQFSPLFGWKPTLPGSDSERFEWSNCDGCPFETIHVVHEVVEDEWYPGFLEVWQHLDAVSAEYRWRVIATYWDGSELASPTATFTVYAFYPVTVSGTVVDASTGDAIDRVHLTLTSGPANWGRRTDAGGTFSFVNGPGGPEQPTLTATKDGYTTVVIPLNVGESAVVNVELTPAP
jgi:hypothetical protein